MDSLIISIKNIKNISSCEFSLPLSQDIYGLIGGNGTGKSTIMLCLSCVLRGRALYNINKGDLKEDSELSITYSGQRNSYIKYYNKNGNLIRLPSRDFKIPGMYEGSLFYGDRFRNSRRVDSLISNNQLLASDLVEADDYVKETLSMIIYGDRDHYKNLYRLKNRSRAFDYGLYNTPYFLTISDTYISQYRMSSGECLLISLLHFIYNSIIRRSLPRETPILMLIDEIELALHPIATLRLIDLLEKLIKQSTNITTLITTHSPELIKRITPRNLFHLENNDGDVQIISPCYPSYAIREVYKHDGFDYLLLVEDMLAKLILNRILDRGNYKLSKLIHICPVGGWNNVLKLHQDLITNNVLGVGKIIISILDGDIKECVDSKYNSYKKLFLPIPSIEKFIYQVMTLDSYRELKKIIGDKFFQIESLDDIYKEYLNELHEKGQNDNNRKILYHKILVYLQKHNISEEQFILRLADDIFEYVDFQQFSESLKTMIS